MVKRVRDSEEGKGASAEVREGVSAGAAAAAAMIAFQEPVFPTMLHKMVLTNNIHFCRCNLLFPLHQGNGVFHVPLFVQYNLCL